MNRPDDLISMLKEDHRELRQLFVEVEFLSGGESLRRTLTDQLIVEMVRHAVAEEAYLYPASLEYLPDGAWIVEQAIIEHEWLEGILRQLEAPDLPDDHFSYLLARLTPDTRRHMDDEEERIFPLLSEYVSREQLVVLGELARKAKERAPSRLDAGSQNRLTTLLETGAGLVGRVREHLCGRGKAYPELPMR
ncbi:hemerythrin domain-containing protein [Actinoallomurus bryophytorum]|uniref:Hemerythrin-like domain-containing protein n=1 Tax=Actinoallomurus bryophytorum TaxID=1490222 RepID=A0A543CMZ7_9ACTN|nr:hemerythrin domain-containing protein [Actinoallomurus bryophytorum]TQL98472.1 hemerythrin-like domain-containing protein [Actinoallomurus bryophytorum]